MFTARVADILITLQKTCTQMMIHMFTHMVTPIFIYMFTPMVTPIFIYMFTPMIVPFLKPIIIRTGEQKEQLYYRTSKSDEGLVLK